MRWETSWDECPQALQEGFSILPIPERLELNRRLCLLQRRRERTQRAWRGSTCSSVEIEGAFVSKNFDETVRLQSEKRQEWIREVRGENYKGLKRAQVALPVWPAYQPRHFPGETSVRGPIVAWQNRKEKTVPARSAKEFRVKGKTGERTEWRGQNESQIGEEKWQACWCCRDQKRACRVAQASAEKLEHTGPAEKERVALVPQRKQLASMPKTPLPRGKRTEPSVQSTRS